MAWDDNNGTDWITSSLNEYLNNDYYTNLSEEAKEQIIKHIWNIGAIKSDNLDLAEQIITEKSNQYSANVGLITVSDWIIANYNIAQCGNLSLQGNKFNYEICAKTNWMHNNENWWTISAHSSASIFGAYYVYSIGYITNDMFTTTGNLLRPSVYLSSEIKIISGSGSSSDTYQIGL